MTKKLTLVMVLVLLVVSFAVNSLAWAAPAVSGKAAVLIDAKSGQVLFEKDKEVSLPPASTTKIMTAILALEKGKLEDVVKVGYNPPRAEGTRIYIVEGEEITLKELIYGMMVHSANDAALAIAEHIAGSKEEFAKMMNAKAKEIGAKNTNFVNPHGLSEEGHTTTAYDLALIGKYAMQNEVFRDVVQSKVLDWEGQEWQTRLININKLLWNQDGATGIKTGYTTEARNTIVGSATKGTQDLIVVVLGAASASNLYDDAERLFTYGFNNFSSVNLAQPNETAATIKIFDQNLELTLAQQVDVTLEQANAQRIERKITLDEINGEVKKGDIVGNVAFLLDGKEVENVKLLANNDVKPKINWIFVVVSTIAGIYILQILIRVLRAYNKKRNSSFSFGGGRKKYGSYRF